MRTPLLTALLVSCASLAPAASLQSVRLIANGKDSAQFEVMLDAPGLVAITAGESPGDSALTASASEPSQDQVITLPGLAPDRRYFYQVSVDGQPAPEMYTFTSGRSWVTRRAVVQVTAAVPGSDDAALADSLFASEADVLLLLGGAGPEGALAKSHGRAMTDRLVAVVGDPSSAETLKMADVTAAWGASAKATLAGDASACWKVGTSADSGANVVVQRAESASVVATGDRMDVALSGRSWANLAFKEGTLTATLHREDGTTDSATLTRTCPIPGAKPVTTTVHSDDADGDGDAGESTSMDGEASSEDCNLP